MLKWPILIISFTILTTAQAAFFSALPAPFSGLDLSLIAVIGLVASFRPNFAYVAAASGGLARDLVTSAPIGSHVVMAVLTAAILIMLFERVITNLSLISFAALNAAGFLICQALHAALRIMTAVTTGGNFWSVDGALSLAAALAVQVSAASFLLLTTKASGKFFRNRFLYTDHA